MKLPEYVQKLLAALRAAGYSGWAVGGCVRDELRGCTPHDYDLCTDAVPEETARVFADYPLITVGARHGTVGVITDGGVVEITTLRCESGYADKRHPDSVSFVSGLTEDLARRDFTVNAMAWSPEGGLCDPFGGQADLRDSILRAVGDPNKRFSEDALRVLRGVRFALRCGLRPEPATLDAMLQCAPALSSVARERIYTELCGIVPLLTVDTMALYAPILAAAVPALAPTVGFDQRSPHHAYDLYTHISHVVAAVPEDLTLRWAALLHDIGKIPTFTQDETGRGHFYGHAAVGADMADKILRDFGAPKALREDAVTLIRLHMTRLMPERKALRRQAAKYGFPLLEKLLILQQADMGAKGMGEYDESEDAPVWALLRELESEVPPEKLAVNGNDLLALGLTGKPVGACLDALRQAVIDERISNTRPALLNEAQKWIREH